MRTRIIWLLVIGSLVGCKHRDNAAAKSGDTGGAAEEEARSRGAHPRDSSDPCALLEQKEIEAASGPLGGPPYRTNEGLEDPTPVAGGDTCVYEMADFRTILLSVTWHDGAAAFKAIMMPTRIFSGVSGSAETAETAKNAAKTLLFNGVQVEGEWDEASGLGCCQIYALRGDSLVKFDYRGWRSNTERALSILNKALLRLDHPFPVDGNAGNEAALKRATLRPAPRPGCSLLSRAEVESVVGALMADPRPSSKDNTEGCIYRFTQAESKEGPLTEAPKEFKSFVRAVTGGRTGMVEGPVEVAMSIRWRGGFRQLNDNALVADAVMGNMQGVPGLPKRTEGKVEGGPWDEAAQTGLTFTAVKKDVAIMIDTEPMLSTEQVELRRRLVAKAIEKISPRE